MIIIIIYGNNNMIKQNIYLKYIKISHYNYRMITT